MAKTNTPFMKPLNLSPELEEVVGKGPMPRSEITSKIWVYIKEHKLQDAKDGRIINADDKLKKVSGGQSSFNMMKLGGFVSKNVS
ncbi:SWIB/MDM2 domain-containing protein [Candidatus Kaiserbacteria bacterium]|nr:SWIB/MDM2 domain-containing protein [Candidatus Kaiserbacteria bacterium]